MHLGKQILSLLHLDPDDFDSLISQPLLLMWLQLFESFLNLDLVRCELVDEDGKFIAGQFKFGSVFLRLLNTVSLLAAFVRCYNGHSDQ